MIVAIGRGLHRLNDAQPWVFDDPYALPLGGPQWPELSATMRAIITDDLFPQAQSALLVRARFTEDRLLSGDFAQYVVLGAGLDSFAWRRPDVVRSVRVFEVDHPDSQKYKRVRAAELALPELENQVFVALDFERETLASALESAGFDWSAPTLFGWLGVTMYLSLEAIEATLRTVAKCATGTEIVFSYGVRPEDCDAVGKRFVDLFGTIATASGEPFDSLFDRDDVEHLAHRCGLRIAEHPTRAELHRRYFGGRADGLTPISAENVIAAAV
jgi:methyltransferase (TIGR00027 family)